MYTFYAACDLFPFIPSGDWIVSMQQYNVCYILLSVIINRILILSKVNRFKANIYEWSFKFTIENLKKLLY